MVAIVGRDGALRIVQLRQGHQAFAMSSFFGSLTCVSWSHDGKYIITGGQDDLVCLKAVCHRLKAFMKTPFRSASGRMKN